MGLGIRVVIWITGKGVYLLTNSYASGIKGSRTLLDHALNTGVSLVAIKATSRTIGHCFPTDATCAGRANGKMRGLSV